MGILDGLHDMQKRWETSQRRMIPGSLGGRTDSASPAPRATAPAAWSGTELALAASTLVAEVTLGLSQSIPNNVITKLTFTTAATWDYNYGLGVEPDPDNRIRVPVEGVYHIEVSVMFAANATGERYVQVEDGGHGFIEGYANIDSTGLATFHGSRDAFLVADEAPYVRVRQTSGGALLVYEARLSVRQVLTTTAGPNGHG